MGASLRLLPCGSRGCRRCGLEDVIRTRTYVTDIDQWEQVARAHSAAFGAAPPATTLVEVSRLIDPAMLVEIEADAVIPTDTEG